TGISPLRRLYETEDGWMCISVTTDPQLRALGQALGVALSDDPRFVSVAAREEHAYQLESILVSAFAAIPSAQIIAELRQAGVPAVVPVIDNNRQFMDDPVNARLG